MSIALDRTGIFKAGILDWRVTKSKSSQAVGIQMEFVIRASLNDANGWDSWAECDEHTVWGTFWVMKADGHVNTKTIEQLVAAFRWNGNIDRVGVDLPPGDEVQITVKEEEFNGQKQIRASWINPGDYKPASAEERKARSAETAKTVGGQFGSLIRAAASAAAAKSAPAQTPARSSAPPPRGGARTPPARSSAPPAKSGGSTAPPPKDAAVCPISGLPMSDEDIEKSIPF